MNLPADHVPLEYIREALEFAVAAGWRPPPSEPANDEASERPTMPPPPCDPVDAQMAETAQWLSTARAEGTPREDVVRAMRQERRAKRIAAEEGGR